MKIGAEILVNTAIDNSQYDQTITTLADGNFVVSWVDYSGTLGDDSQSSIKAQIFSRSGDKVGSEFLVNSFTEGEQFSPAISSLAGGGFVATWFTYEGSFGNSTGSSIRAQIFDAGGEKTGVEFLVNTALNANHFGPAVSGLSSGGFVVTWYDYSGTLGDSSSSSIKAQLYGSDGLRVGAEFLVNTQTVNGQFSPAVTELANGHFVISWYDYSGTLGDASASSTKMQIYDASGNAIGSEVLVNTQTEGDQYTQTISALTGGGFVVGWTDSSGALGDADGTAIVAQIFDASGNRTGTEILVNTETAGYQTSPTVTGLSDGGFVVSWDEVEGSGVLGDADGYSIHAQVFSAAGVKIGSEILVNTATASDQYQPTVTALANNDFVISWFDYSPIPGDYASGNIKAQIFSVDSVLETHGATVSGTTDFFNGFDKIVVAETLAESVLPVSLRLLDAGTVSLADALGTRGATVYAAATGNTIQTGAGADRVIQTVSHLDNGGIVVFHGGDGIDTLQLFAGAGGPVIATLDADGSVRYTADGRSVVTSVDVERLVVTASSGEDTLMGAMGSDWLNGGAGADTFHGSLGDDGYVFDDTGDAVVGERVSVGTDSIWASVSVDLGDQDFVENLRLTGSASIDGSGNDLANLITGNSGSNVITGGAGIDSLYGKGGSDAFFFAEKGAGNKDSIWDFDGGNDTILLDHAAFSGLAIAFDGSLSASSFAVNKAVGTGPQIIYSKVTGVLCYDINGTLAGGAEDIVFIGKNLASFDNRDVFVV